MDDYSITYEDKMARFMEIIKSKYNPISDDINLPISSAIQTKKHGDDVPILQRLQDGTDSEETDSEETVFEEASSPILEQVNGDKDGLSEKFGNPKNGRLYWQRIKRNMMLNK